MTPQQEATAWELVKAILRIEERIEESSAEVPPLLRRSVALAHQMMRRPLPLRAAPQLDIVNSLVPPRSPKAHAPEADYLRITGDAPPTSVELKTLSPSAPRPDRAEAIKRIREALRRRSGKAWSVTGGRGTAWGWLTIDAPPARRKFNSDGTPSTTDGGHMHPDEQKELAQLLGLKDPVHFQGVSIPSGGNYYDEYIARAEGRTPEVYGEVYWD